MFSDYRDLITILGLPFSHLSKLARCFNFIHGSTQEQGSGIHFIKSELF